MRGGEPPDCRTAAIGYLARRSHTRRELTLKLRRKGYPELEIEATLEGLVESGLLDDASAAGEVVRAQLRKGRGRSRVSQALAARGVFGETAAAALSGLRPEEEEERLKAALERRSRTLPAGLTPAARSKKLFDHLVRRGFSPGAVREALREKGSHVDDDPD